MDGFHVLVPLRIIDQLPAASWQSAFYPSFIHDPNVAAFPKICHLGDPPQSHLQQGLKGLPLRQIREKVLAAAVNPSHHGSHDPRLRLYLDQGTYTGHGRSRHEPEPTAHSGHELFHIQERAHSVR